MSELDIERQNLVRSGKMKVECVICFKQTKKNDKHFVSRKGYLCDECYSREEYV